MDGVASSGGLLTVARTTVERALRIDRATSYRVFQRGRVHGRLSFDDVRRRVQDGARNGAKLPLGFLAQTWLNWKDAERATGLTGHQLRRVLKKSEHFILNRKNALIDPTVLRAALAR